MLGLFRREDPVRLAAARLQRAIAERARSPVFHTHYAVPDTVDGRFDLFTLHAYLVLERLKAMGSEEAGQHLANEIFASFENALREMGVSDAGFSRRIKAMANAFYGRVAAYDAATSEDALAEVVLRNLYRGEDRKVEANTLAHYMQAVRERLRDQDVSTGEIDFAPLPTKP